MDGRRTTTVRTENGRRIVNGHLTQAQSNNIYENKFEQGEMEPQNDQYNYQGMAANGTQQPSPQSSREPQHMGAYMFIPPNESKRDKLQRMAKKELEDLEHWKEAHRPGPINLTPKKLGGGYVSQAEARQKQQIVQSQSKYQKMLQKEEYKIKLRQEEEAEIQKKKAIQRQKAEKLEEKRREQELERQLKWEEDNYLRNNEFLNQMSQHRTSYYTHDSPGNTSSAWARSQAYKQQEKEEESMRLQEMKAEQRRKSEYLETKKRQEEEDRRLSQQEHRRRVNNAFLDRLERLSVVQPNEVQENSYTWS
ncbi:epithelial-stromal interaction protein 1 [Bombina bombina]|uniref:epithelial-stromal interaction protein 1 n=1 Tax=Bombina bombina TaxID=8345 RepID=UPI00235AA976|nr:epithelial-stromal interaction protein 1 [Bombina bombina]